MRPLLNWLTSTKAAAYSRTVRFQFLRLLRTLQTFQTLEPLQTQAEAAAVTQATQAGQPALGIGAQRNRRYNPRRIP